MTDTMKFDVIKNTFHKSVDVTENASPKEMSKTRVFKKVSLKVCMELCCELTPKYERRVLCNVSTVFIHHLHPWKGNAFVSVCLCLLNLAKFKSLPGSLSRLANQTTNMQ